MIKRSDTEMQKSGGQMINEAVASQNSFFKQFRNV
jgi:hypothetical protein